MPTRVEIVEQNLDAYLASAEPAARRLDPPAPLRPGTGLSARQAVELFEDQALSRALDVEARRLRARDAAFYTISSAGHEQNAAVGAQLRLDDHCFLHYRSGAFMMARARRLPGQTPAFDTLLGLCASAEDPVAGGRHKIWGSVALGVVPQTSTIASHLPKAVGYAFSHARARRLGLDEESAPDALVCCSFGDASANHATALSGVQAARYAQRRGASMPVLFLCEDNGWGISVDTPRNWIQDTFSNLPFLRYYRAAGDVDEIRDTVTEAIAACRTRRGPVFLHLPCVRLWAHAGSAVETAYRSIQEIEATEAQDPILRNARRLVECGAATPEELRALVRDTRQRVAAAAQEAAARPKLRSRARIVAPLATYDEERCRRAATEAVPPERRREVFGERLPEDATGRTQRTLAAHINAALADEMARHPGMLVFGEDVGRKGGVYGVTLGLQKKFGVARVFDTQLDETTILGLAQGAGMAGLLPVAEIQYLAYVHNAIDQIRGEACSLSFFSSGRYVNPMVVRIASFAYQRGFGGHFHNDH
ncbi:MAG: thiamine pyrophosphate-dependent enzyme, partial [Planctomycetota bacterium]